MSKSIMKPLRVITCILCFVISANPFATTTVQYKKYEVTGLTPEDLFIAITTGSPIGSSGLTSVVPENSSWNGKINENGEHVFLSVSINQTITITLPEWKIRTGAKPCTIDQWNSAMSALRAHEEHHRKIYEEFETIVTARAVHIRPQPTEDHLFAELQMIMKQVAGEISKYQKDYDAKTKHGKLEGVVLNPC